METWKDVQYRLKVLLHKHAAKPRPPPFCFPRICHGGTKTTTSVRTKATEHRGRLHKILHRDKTDFGLWNQVAAFGVTERILCFWEWGQKIRQFLSVFCRQQVREVLHCTLKLHQFTPSQQPLIVCCHYRCAVANDMSFHLFFPIYFAIDKIAERSRFVNHSKSTNHVKCITT